MDYMQVIENWRKQVVWVSVNQIPFSVCALILALESEGFTCKDVTTELIEDVATVFVLPDSELKDIQKKYVILLVKEHFDLCNGIGINKPIDDLPKPSDIFVDENGKEKEWVVDPIPQSTKEIDVDDYDNEFLAQIGIKAEDIIR